MKAIILAAGIGKRLRPLTYAIPKPLLPVGGRPVIEYVIDNLEGYSEIDEIFIAVSHKADVIKDYLLHVPRPGLKFTVVHTHCWETGGDLLTVIREKKISGPVIICYGDNVTKIDVSKLVEMHGNAKGAYATIALFPVPKSDVTRFGIAEIDGQKIKRFIEKPQEGETTSNLANAGYFVLDSEIVKDIEVEKFKIESEYFPIWAAEGKLAGQIQDVKIWIDIGTIDAYRSANKLVEAILPPPESELVIK